MSLRFTKLVTKQYDLNEYVSSAYYSSRSFSWQTLVNQSSIIQPPLSCHHKPHKLIERKRPLQKKVWISRLYFTNETIKVRILLPTYSAKLSISLVKAETNTLKIMAEFHSLLCFITTHGYAEESSHILDGVKHRELWHTHRI